MFSVLIATCFSDLIATLHGGPYSAVTQLRVNPSCQPSFLEVHLVRGVTFWVPTCVPQLLVTHLGGVSTFLSYHARGSPLGVASSWVVSVPGFPCGSVGTSRVRLPLLVLELIALKPPFSSLHCCSKPSEPKAFSRCCPLHVPPYPWVSGGNTVDILILIVSLPGDAFARRRLCEATPFLGDAPSGQPVDLPSLLWGPRADPPYVDFDFDFWSTPWDGTSFLPQRITRSKFKELRSSGQMFSLLYKI